jgi:DNA-binding transcriptional LysR family regulator
MDKLQAFSSFIEVASTGSFTQAADKLNLSRVKVTRDVQQLEQWLNLRLLHRTTRKVSLTAPGIDVLHYCERILNEVSGLESVSLTHNQCLTGEIRIAAPIGLGQNNLYQAIETFSRLHPNVNIQLVLCDHNADLVNERIDIALRHTQQPSELLIAKRLISIESAICCSKQYLQDNGPITCVEQLKDHNCLIHISQQNWSFIDGQQLLSTAVQGNIKANDISVLAKAAVNGLGVAYLPADLANKYLQSGQLQQILPDTLLPITPMWAVYLSRSYQRPLVRTFIEFLSELWCEDIKVFKTKVASH